MTFRENPIIGDVDAIESSSVFNGQCEAAFKYYEKCLGGSILMMMTYKSPRWPTDCADRHDKILHATFAVGDQILTGGDEPPESYRRPGRFRPLYSTLPRPRKPTASSRHSRKAVRLGCPSRRPSGRALGMLVDQFGTPWMINCGNPNYSSTASHRRACGLGESSDERGLF